MGALGQGKHLALDLAFQTLLGYFQVVMRLQVEPELRGGAESARQTQGGIGSDAALALNNGVDAIRRYAQGARQGVLADFQRLEEFFQQNLTGMDGRNFTGHFTPLVIVNNFNLVGVPVLPDEAQPVAIVNTDAVLSFTVAAQFLQAVSGRHAQVFWAGSGIQNKQLAQGSMLQLGRQVRMTLSLEQVFRVVVVKGLDHVLSISCNTYHVNQDGG